MQLIKAITPVALHIHQRFLAGIALRNLSHDPGKIHLHCGLRCLFWLVENAF
jgi:hypothetical protein